MSSLKKNIIALFFMQGINYMVPLITLPYLTRALGVHQYGALNIALSLIQYAILFTNFGFNLSTTKNIAIYKHDKFKVSQLFWETLLAKFVLGIISIGIVYLVVAASSTLQEIKWVILILFIQVFAAVLSPDWFFQGIEKISNVSVVTSIMKLTTIPLLFWLVHNPSDLFMASFILSITLLIASLTALSMAAKNILIIRIPLRNLRVFNTMKESFPLFVGTIAISLYTASTPLILGLTNTFEQAGLYSASFRIRSAVTGIFLILGQVFYPRASALFTQNPEKGYQFVALLFKWLLPLSLLAAVVFYFIVPPLAAILLGPSFKNTEPLLQIMAPMMVLIPMSVILSNYLLLPLGHKKIFFMLPILTASLHIPYTIVLSHLYGAKGASLAILITEVISFTGLVIASSRLTSIYKYIKFQKRI